MLDYLIAPQSKVIRAILLENSPCCGGAHLRHEVSDLDEAAVRVEQRLDVVLGHVLVHGRQRRVERVGLLGVGGRAARSGSGGGPPALGGGGGGRSGGRLLARGGSRPALSPHDWARHVRGAFGGWRLAAGGWPRQRPPALQLATAQWRTCWLRRSPWWWRDLQRRTTRMF